MTRDELIAVLISLGVEYDQEELSWRSTETLEHIISIILKHKGT
jgi:hypothetical protein